MKDQSTKLSGESLDETADGASQADLQRGFTTVNETQVKDEFPRPPMRAGGFLGRPHGWER